MDQNITWCNEPFDYRKAIGIASRASPKIYLHPPFHPKVLTDHTTGMTQGLIENDVSDWSDISAVVAGAYHTVGLSLIHI